MDVRNGGGSKPPPYDGEIETILGKKHRVTTQGQSVRFATGSTPIYKM